MNLEAAKIRNGITSEDRYLQAILEPEHLAERLAWRQFCWCLTNLITRGKNEENNRKIINLTYTDGLNTCDGNKPGSIRRQSGAAI